MYLWFLQNSLLCVSGGRKGEGREALCAHALSLPTEEEEFSKKKLKKMLTSIKSAVWVFDFCIALNAY